MKKAIMPYVAKALSSEGVKTTKRALHEGSRRIRGAPHRLQVFLRVDDPYSALLVQAMPDILERFDVHAEFHTVRHLDEAMFPAPQMWEANAWHDAAHLAKLYDLPYRPSDSLRERQTVENATATLLLAEQDTKGYLRKAQEVFGTLWGDQARAFECSTRLDDPALMEQLARNEQMLDRKGHYLSAMIHYAGEWYWGLDRLDHLERRLIGLGANRRPNATVRFDRTYRGFCTGPSSQRPDPETPLEIFWSARSPYSYIGLERAVQLAHFHDIPLTIKPVLPMMMRGMNVPTKKKMYIFLDTKREAAKFGLPYGFVADPLGAAVERCYALVDYARQENRLEAFLLSFARAVNAQGIRAETDKGMRTIVERAGLSWEQARAMLDNKDWREWAEANQQEMFSLGCWGVPSFSYCDLVFWGQDRLGIIEKAILEEANAISPDGQTVEPA